MDYKLLFPDKKLLNIDKPARYIGIEMGIPNIDFKNREVRFAISYPDIYELGMSNNGIKIIYDRINRLPFASAERFFAPWMDFEQFLRENKIPLFSLETKSKLIDFDFIGFSIQYELLFTNILNMIDLIGIPLFAKDRIDNDPIVIAGGPVATSNPMP